VDGGGSRFDFDAEEGFGRLSSRSGVSLSSENLFTDLIGSSNFVR
jgi:hypothetical protein